ncbi:hypothetical protein [Streptomyces bohaiensis]|uniref:DUF4350 domain-containing protein n=1 Tax=Streptomyces bohaiensis TaxID=1431344 RepID=A0ABX1CIZ0_9ACTN|nr:hypothetical protein [Streptomyces bohaiensis]NJQ17244.1 hypothetical protein [Streptomyces bohaiensis]
MRQGLRRGAGTLAAALVLGLLTAPTARADGQLADAAAALATPGVWVDDDYQGLDENMVALLRARYERADTPFRMALLTERNEDAAGLASQLASLVGRPGVYAVLTEWDDPLSDSRDSSRGWAVSGVPATVDDIRDESVARAGINNGNPLLTLVDSLDGDLSAQLPTGSGDGRFLVDPAVTEVFPELTEDLLAETFAGVPELRVALVSGVGGPSDAAATAMASELPADGAMLLMQWETSDFSVVMGSGRELASNSTLESLVGGIGIPTVAPDAVPHRLAQLAAALGPDLVGLAREGLADSPLYVHPAAGDGTTGPARQAAFAAALGEAGARAAVLPQGAVAAQLGEDSPDAADELVRSVAEGGDDPLAVFLVDTEYQRVDEVRATGDEQFAAAADRARYSGDPFVETALTHLLDHLGADVPRTPEADGADGADAPAAPAAPGGSAAAGPAGAASLPVGVWVGLAVATLGLLAPVVAAAGTPRGRPHLAARALAIAANRRRADRMSAQELGREVHASAAQRGRNGQDLARLEKLLRQLPDTGGHPAARPVGQLLGEYERLREAHAGALTRSEASLVGRSLTRALRRGTALAAPREKRSRPS